MPAHFPFLLLGLSDVSQRMTQICRPPTGVNIFRIPANLFFVLQELMSLPQFIQNALLLWFFLELYFLQAAATWRPPFPLLWDPSYFHRDFVLTQDCS
ncbi:hypothetical protein AVEN_26913-1 [Araneus ventricosus]|uniref:Uncharacterized protein n=1 Tax=Araneus ventricosus TaxID=182803 RepID=A0A4Y2VAF1_ARAVE|nr:hypothetical protein AVEN_16405-1 [Araneus ventricosus]GBO21561.1 hypothetical protein AVEN_26913-1 [Araneus ventricosus]